MDLLTTDSFDFFMVKSPYIKYEKQEVEKEDKFFAYLINDINDKDFENLFNIYFKKNDDDNNNTNLYGEISCSLFYKLTHGFVHNFFSFRIFEFVFNGNGFDCFYFGDDEFLKKKLIIKILNSFEKIAIEKIFFSDFICIDDDIVYSIGNFIKNSINVETFYFDNKKLKNNHIKILCNYLNNHKKLKYLDFYGCRGLTDECLEFFINPIKTTFIESIIFYELTIKKKEYYLFDLLFYNFIHNKNPNFDFKNSNLNDDNIIKMNDIIIKKNVNYIERIDLSYNKNITQDAFLKLFNLFINLGNKNINYINISDNILDDIFIETLGKLIKQNKYIISINLNRNKITDNGLNILFEYIIGNTSIDDINLCMCEITNNSIETIKNMIKLSHIKKMDLFMTNIDSEFIDEIRELLKIPIEEREVPLFTIKDVKSASKRMKE